MGLDTTHDCWRGAYSAFTRWRDKLGKVAGYTYHYDVQPHEDGGLMKAYVSESRVTPDLDWGNIEKTIGITLLGKWDEIPYRPDGTQDPLIILLAHPDCEGQIQSKFCGPLADRLEELVPLLGDEDGGGHVGSYAETTKRFIKGLRLAAKRGENVTFH